VPLCHGAGLFDGYRNLPSVCEMTIDAFDRVGCWQNLRPRHQAELGNGYGFDRCNHWNTYIGQGAVRFYLPLNVQLPNDYLAQAVVVTKDVDQRERVKARLEQALATGSQMSSGGFIRWNSAPRMAAAIQGRHATRWNCRPGSTGTLQISETRAIKSLEDLTDDELASVEAEAKRQAREEERRH
jgi:hypothetical protein